MRFSALSICLFALSLPAFADAPVVEDISAQQSTGGDWTFSVTLSHPETGWDHYADGWEVLGPDGTRLGFRELVHPHVNEQPFTRSLSRVVIPGSISTVQIRARDNVDGWAAETYEFALPN